MQTWTGGQLHTFPGHVATDRLSGAWWLLATTGMRRGEVLGLRWADVDPATVTALKTHRTRQLEERMALGTNYADQDLVVCQLDGSPLHPKNLSYKFGKAAGSAALPAIRLHDLRHSHATLALRAGIHPRVVQERLGHANTSVTLNTYSHVDLELRAAAAKLVAELVTGTES